MTLDHAHWEDLVEAEEAENHYSLVIKPIDIQPYIIQPKCYRFDNIVRMLIHIFQKLLDIWVSASVKVRIINIDDHIFEIVFFLFPFKVLLKFRQTECLEEDLDAQMFEIVRLCKIIY